MLRALVPAAAALLFSLSQAHAQAIIAQSSGLVAPAQTIDFGANLFPNFTPVSTQFPGITITHATYFTTGVSNNLIGGFLTNDFSVGPPNTLRIVFANPITDLSFVYHQIAPGTTVMRAMLQGVTVDTFSGSWNQFQTNNWFGFTNTLFDELQIDFLGDFNVDQLDFNPAGGTTFASCNTFNGSNVNPASLGCLTLPVLGTTWQGQIATTPTTALTVLFYAPGGPAAAVPLFGGELLVSLSPPPVGFTSPTGAYSIVIPSTASLAGSLFTFQGMRLEVIGGTPTFVLLNGVQLVLGF